MHTRRDLLKGLAGVAAFALAPPVSKAVASTATPVQKKIVPPDEALALLREGNRRFVAVKRQSEQGISEERRNELTAGQWPFATILCCSDSRVPPELIFDAGLGDLFVVRVAGNLLDPALLGSIEYASLHSTSRLILVLGHESCGAVTATVHVASHPEIKETPGIQDIVNRLLPAVLRAEAETHAEGSALVAAAVRKNVEMVVDEIAHRSESLRTMVDAGKLKIVGGHYALASGKVDFWS